MREKADALLAAEGISPDCGMTNVQGTTRVSEQSMYLKGRLGNWREPTAFLYSLSVLDIWDGLRRANKMKIVMSTWQLAKIG